MTPEQYEEADWRTDPPRGDTVRDVDRDVERLRELAQTDVEKSLIELVDIMRAEAASLRERLAEQAEGIAHNVARFEEERADLEERLARLETVNEAAERELALQVERLADAERINQEDYAAQARADEQAIEILKERLAEAQRDRDEFEEMVVQAVGLHHEYANRAEAAEAERDTLRGDVETMAEDNDYQRGENAKLRAALEKHHPPPHTSEDRRGLACIVCGLQRDGRALGTGAQEPTEAEMLAEGGRDERWSGGTGTQDE